MKTNKTKMIQGLTALVVAIVVVFGAYLVFSKNSDDDSRKKTKSAQNEDTSDAARFKKEYKTVSDGNRFVYASEDEITSIFKDGTGLVFLGFPECPWCQSLSGMTDQAAKNQNLDRIYYLDIRGHREDNSKTYQALVTKLEPYLEKDEQGKPRIFVPDVTAVKDGKVVGRYEMEEGSEAEMAGGQETYWTTDRKARTVQKLEAMVQKLK
jgi:hypothetical protein